MTAAVPAPRHEPGLPFELRFGSLHDPGRGFSFPCDADGRVATERLSAPLRQSYLRVLHLVGREFAPPVLAPAG